MSEINGLYSINFMCLPLLPWLMQVSVSSALDEEVLPSDKVACLDLVLIRVLSRVKCN